MRNEISLPNFENMAHRLRRVHDWSELFEKLRANYGTLSDYAHGQARQVSRFITVDGIGPVHRPEEMIEVLRFVDLVDLLACIRRQAIADRPTEPLTSMLDRVFRRSYQVRPPDRFMEERPWVQAH